VCPSRKRTPGCPKFRRHRPLPKLLLLVAFAAALSCAALPPKERTAVVILADKYSLDSGREWTLAVRRK